MVDFLLGFAVGETDVDEPMVDDVVCFSVDGFDVVPGVDIESLNVVVIDWCWVLLSFSWVTSVVPFCIPVGVTVVIGTSVIFSVKNNDFDL